jgi:Dehydrogenases (flavoproteins)
MLEPNPMSDVERDVMEYDVVTVGAGPAGLAFAIRLKQLNPDISVCVIEKASTIGAHILSGAVIEPQPLDALLPGWRDTPPPICVPATDDEFWYFSKDGGRNVPDGAAGHAQPRQLHRVARRDVRVAGTAGRSAGRGDLSGLRRRRDAARR